MVVKARDEGVITQADGRPKAIQAVYGCSIFYFGGISRAPQA